MSYVKTDELIRQVTINCAERGLLLLRIRDEIHMTITAYQMLYESSVAFGMRKALKEQKVQMDRETEVTVVWRTDAHTHTQRPTDVQIYAHTRPHTHTHTHTHTHIHKSAQEHLRGFLLS